MSAYAINKVCVGIRNDPSFRWKLSVRPEETLLAVRPALSEEEITAFLEGDAAKLSALGANRYLMLALARLQIGGLTPTNYVEKLRQAYLAAPEARSDIYYGTEAL
jgi:hypothetical protein